MKTIGPKLATEIKTLADRTERDITAMRAITADTSVTEAHELIQGMRDTAWELSERLYQLDDVRPPYLSPRR